VVKNKVASPFKTAEFDILYGEYQPLGEVLDLGVAAHCGKAGAWYAAFKAKMVRGVTTHANS
jgi:recombination protein RecA